MNRVGNADLYIGMVRKRKSLPRDSRGFEPIEEYLREVEEDLNQESSGIDSGEETDVEGEKRKEVHAWELHRHAREKERERRRAEEEEAKRLARERERQHQTAAEAQDREPSKDAASQKKRGTHPRQLGSRRSLRLQAVHSDTDDRESSQSGTDSEMPPLPAVEDRESGSDLQSGLEGGRPEEGTRERRQATMSTRGRGRPRKSATASKKAVPTARTETERKRGEEMVIQQEMTRATSSGDSSQEREGEGERGRVGVDGSNMYSPEVADVPSPSRDTIKLGPVRLTFSASPSDDERRWKSISTAAEEKRKHRKRSPTPPTTETTSAAVSKKQTAVRGSEQAEEEGGRDSERESTTGRDVTFRRNISFNPKKTSTHVKGGKRGPKSSAKKRVLAGGGAGGRGLESGSEENETGDEEEDRELQSLLNPSTHVSRLVGLSQLTRSGRQPLGPGAGRGESSTDEEHTAPENSASVGKEVQSRAKRKSAIRATGNHTTSSKGKKKSSRKSVAFNPRTTNLGSPEIPPPPRPRPAAAVSSTEESDTGGSSAGVYDQIPSDEEDYTHSKSRLYSPRRKNILRKAASMKKSKSKTAQRQEKAESWEEKEAKQEVVTGRGGSIREFSVQLEDISSGGQWFVPEELNIHKMISDNSPRSLRRLTRSTRQPDTSSDTVPQPVRRRKRRPRELDSTVGAGEGGEGGEGASKSEEEKERNKDTEKRNLSSVSAKSGGGKKSYRRSAKLTPPWRKSKQKSTTQHSSGDKHTPAAKKVRVTTPEEDEGMASGGGLSFSSSEEEEAQDLVRSMGGRRYRRYVVDQKERKTPGVRRSQRSRVAPLQHWMNEEPEYERRRSGVTLKSVLIPLERMQKKSGKKPAVLGDDKTTPQQLTFTDKHGIQQTLDVVTRPSLCASTNGQGDPASKSDELVITKLFSSPSTSCGLLQLSYLGEKERSSTTTHEVFFFVLKGKVLFIVGRQEFDLAAESQIRIPAGVNYAVKNVHRGLARLYYYSHQIHK